MPLEKNVTTLRVAPYVVLNFWCHDRNWKFAVSICLAEQEPKVWGETTQKKKWVLLDPAIAMSGYSRSSQREKSEKVTFSQGKVLFWEVRLNYCKFNSIDLFISKAERKIQVTSVMVFCWMNHAALIQGKVEVTTIFDMYLFGQGNFN